MPKKTREKSRTPSREQCDCIEKVNEKLAEHGGKLDAAVDLMTGKSFLVLKTVRLEGKKPAPLNMVPSFCPFCGKKYA